MVARPTASKGWRLEPEHGRRRPAAGVTTLEQQQEEVRQEEAATRHGHSRRRYVKDFRPHYRLDGDTRGRQYDSSSGSETLLSHSVGLTLRQLQRQRRLLWLLSFATELPEHLHARSTFIRLFVTGRAAIHLRGTKKQTMNSLSSRRTTRGRYLTKGQPLYMKMVDRTTDR